MQRIEHFTGPVTKTIYTERVDTAVKNIEASKEKHEEAVKTLNLRQDETLKTLTQRQEEAGNAKSEAEAICAAITETTVTLPKECFCPNKQSWKVSTPAVRENVEKGIVAVAATYSCV
jgi:hypothetical protein